MNTTSRARAGLRPALSALALVAATAPLSGQQPSSVLSLEPDVVGVTVGYARALDAGRYRGVELGAGGPFWNRMLLAGRHFSHENGPSYEPRDGATDKRLIEVAHVAIFHRWVAEDRGWDLDVGVRGSVFYHSDTSDDDVAFPSFLGGYAGMLFGNERVKLGPELLVGWFSEGLGVNELGVMLAPVTGRITFGWGRR